MTIEQAIQEAERKAWRALASYKFIMFGYHAAIWVELNRIAQAEGQKRRPNPFRDLVKIAREVQGVHSGSRLRRALGEHHPAR